MPHTKSKKMMYSSVGDEDRRRANQVKEERNNLQYRKFNNNDISATMNDITDTVGNHELNTIPHSPGKGKPGYQQIDNNNVTTTMMDENANPYDVDGDGL